MDFQEAVQGWQEVKEVICQMFGKPFKLHPKAEEYVFTYGGNVLARITKKTLKTLLADLCLDNGVRLAKEKFERLKRKKRKKSKLTKSKMLGETVVKAEQFSKAYFNAKKDFFKNKHVSEISKGEPAFQYFVAAIPMLEKHNVTYKKFIRAQIDGLSFVNQGRGIFPSPSQLCNEGAERRLLEFMRQGGEEDGSKHQVHLTKEDRETYLSDNQWFIARRQKLKDGVATLDEAQYVAELQRIRRGKVEPYVEEYISGLLSGE